MFVAFAVFTFIFIAIATSLAVSSSYARSRIKVCIRQISITSLAAIPSVGGLSGNFYSHGFDVPWWAFGIASGLCTLAVGVIVLFVAYNWRKYFGKQ
jgi:hypothetical protein